MKNLKKNTKGITLVTLVITIVVLLILASIATYSGIEVIKSSRLTTFTTEMKIMQTQVNELYQKYKDGDSTVLDLGKDLNIVSEQANKVLNASGTAETEQNEYRYFDQDTIKNLKIEGVEGEFFINIKTRSVVSYEGFKYDDRIYYTLEQLPNGLYNVEYTDANEGIDSPTFDTSVEKISEGKWRVTVSNIQYDGYINNWKVNYKLEGQDFWNTTEDLSFIATESGEYVLQLVNGNIKSDEKIITVKQGEILPAEYQQVEYIESTGTQYIYTKLSYKVNFEINCVFQLTELKNTYQTIMGQDTYDVRIDANGYFRGIVDLPYIGLTKHTCKIIANSVNNERNIKVDDKSYSQTHSYELNGYCAIFTNGSNVDNRKSKARFYYGNIYLSNELRGNFIPCYCNTIVIDANGKECPAGTIGLYDTVNNQFYTNQGTGTFEKGNDV